MPQRRVLEQRPGTSACEHVGVPTEAHGLIRAARASDSPSIAGLKHGLDVGRTFLQRKKRRSGELDLQAARHPAWQRHAQARGHRRVRDRRARVAAAGGGDVNALVGTASVIEHGPAVPSPAGYSRRGVRPRHGPRLGPASI
jgi:hypothetical protein